MNRLIEGLTKFSKDVFESDRELFATLAAGQHPRYLFITCSDSRIDPSLLTQTKPGELFIIRNAGNIVPAFDGRAGGESATVEFALTALDIRRVVVCGHTLCGAMGALMQPESTESLPHVRQWLEYAAPTAQIVRDHYSELDEKRKSLAAVEINVLMQILNLRTHPAVASKWVSGQVEFHGWVYHIESGHVTEFDPEQGRFVTIAGVGEPEISGPMHRLASQ